LKNLRSWIEITDNQNIKFKEKQMELENLMKEMTEGIILSLKSTMV
jgi:hypothetical protein